jgi:hypothetical protein
LVNQEWEPAYNLKKQKTHKTVNLPTLKDCGRLCLRTRAERASLPPAGDKNTMFSRAGAQASGWIGGVGLWIVCEAMFI